MKEIELKFQVPAHRLQAVRHELQGHIDTVAPGQQPLPLMAAYFDTADHALAQRRCALRVRQEGADWVQTFKGAGADLMTRLEENCDVPPPVGGRPQPDAACHSDAVRSALTAALGLPDDVPVDVLQAELGRRLIPLYETCFERRHFKGSDPLGHGTVMVCLDEGTLRAGDRQAPLAELELELVDGSPNALLTVAQDWVARHGLWLDVQSKAMKGTRLAQVAHSGQPRVTEPVAPSARPATAHARQGLSHALEVCTGNWAELAQGLPAWEPALHAWQTAHGQFTPWLPADANDPLCQAHRALGEALAQVNDLGQAQALATQPRTTLWALAWLAQLHAMS